MNATDSIEIAEDIHISVCTYIQNVIIFSDQKNKKKLAAMNNHLNKQVTAGRHHSGLSVSNPVHTTTLSISTGTKTFTGLLPEDIAVPCAGVIFFHCRGLTPDSEWYITAPSGVTPD